MRSSSSRSAPRELKGLAEPLVVCEAIWERSATEGAVPLPAFLDIAASFPVLGARHRARAHHRAVEGDRRGRAARRVRLRRAGHRQDAPRHRAVPGRARPRCHRAVGSLRRGARRSRTSRSPRRCATTSRAVEPERLRAEVGPLGGELDAHRARPRGARSRTRRTAPGRARGRAPPPVRERRRPAR